MYQILIGVFIFLSVMVVFVSVVCYFQNKFVIKFKSIAYDQKEQIDKLDRERHQVIIDFIVLEKKVRRFCSKCRNKEACVRCDLMTYNKPDDKPKGPVLPTIIRYDVNMIQPDKPWERE